MLDELSPAQFEELWIHQRFWPGGEEQANRRVQLQLIAAGVKDLSLEEIAERKFLTPADEARQVLEMLDQAGIPEV